MADCSMRRLFNIHVSEWRRIKSATAFHWGLDHWWDPWPWQWPWSVGDSLRWQNHTVDNSIWFQTSNLFGFYYASHRRARQSFMRPPSKSKRPWCISLFHFTFSCLTVATWFLFGHFMFAIGFELRMHRCRCHTNRASVDSPAASLMISSDWNNEIEEADWGPAAYQTRERWTPEEIGRGSSVIDYSLNEIYPSDWFLVIVALVISDWRRLGTGERCERRKSATPSCSASVLPTRRRHDAVRCSTRPI